MSAKSGLWNRFQSHQGGNVAIIFGLSAFFLVAITGGAIDFSRINDARNKMQDAADIAVLRGALTASQGETISETAAQQAFDDNFDDRDIILGEHSLKKTVIDNVSKLNYTATATIKPIFLGLVGLGTQTLTVSSVAQSEVNPFELALVLDVTGSMNQSSKLTNLKSSVTSVLNSLLDANGKNSSEVKVGVVPFNTQVRMEKSANYAFVDYTKCSTTAGSSSTLYYACLAAYQVYDTICNDAKSSRKADCLSSATNKMFYNINEGSGEYSATARAYEKLGNNDYNIYTYTVTASINATTHQITYSNDGVKKSNEKNKDAYKYYSYSLTDYNSFLSSPIITGYASSWTGCLEDRGQPYDVSADAFNADIPDSAYPAIDCDSSSPKVIQDMTTSISDTKTYVNSLTANGSTNITIGVQMGMELLSPEAPYTEGVVWGDPDMDKYMIVVTDGENTGDRWYGQKDSSSIDARTALACQAAKDKGITVFVVRVMEGNSGMLQKCASKTIYYYDLKSASQLNATMADIFMRIGKLRIVQ
jgi:Flp pilus assembly protein TadG